MIKRKTRTVAFMLLFLLILLDLVCIGVHSLYCFQESTMVSSMFLLDTIHGLPELFQFFKYTIILLFLGIYFIKKRWVGFIPLLILFVLLFLDDIFQLHRFFGHELYRMFQLKGAWGLRGTDFGYIMYAFFIGILFLILIYLGVQKRGVIAKNFYKTIFFLLCVLFFFGFGVDILSLTLAHQYGKFCFLTIIEEGGEMIVLSLLIWYMISTRGGYFPT